MSNLLRDHALKNVWCTPQQDNQYIIKPVRIGPAHGNIGTVTVHNVSHTLPNSTQVPLKRYAVFDIGPLAPWLVNFPLTMHKWYSVDELMNTRNIDIWLYKKTGFRIPSGLGYIKRAADNGYILAVEHTGFFSWDLEQPDEQLYIRVYSNAFFRTTRFRDGGYTSTPPQYLGVEYIHGKVGTTITTSALQSFIVSRLAVQQASMTDAKGGLYAFADGELIWPLQGSQSFTAGQYAEVVWDMSIYRSKQIFLEDMPQFTSTVDGKAKYIVLPWLDSTEDNIEYHDDVDFYLCRGNRGVYMHRNAVDAVRQLTNASYSVPVDHVAAYVTDNPWLDVNDPRFPATSKPYILMRFRKSGYERTVVEENSYLKELIKLGETEVMSALTGNAATVPEWRAENIEADAYNQIMSAWTPDVVTNDLAYEAYGYNQSAKMLLPVDLTASNNGSTTGPLFFEPPPQFDDVTAVMFDQNGGLLRVRGSSGGATMQSAVAAGKPEQRVQHAKLIKGKLGTNALNSSFYDMLTVSNGKPVREQGFRCYMCTRLAGDVPDNDWRVVEENEGIWSVSADGLSIEWDEAAVTSFTGYTAVRFGNHVVYSQSLAFQDEEDGVITFETSTMCTVAGASETVVEYIPYAMMLVFSEGKLLVEGIDYYVDWPRVVVVRKYQAKNVSLILAGLCNDDLTRDTVSEAGFTYRSILSADANWHIRNDRNVIVNVGGNVVRPETVQGFESYWEVDPPYLQLGQAYPYSVIDVVQQVEPVIGITHDTVNDRAVSTELRGRVEAFMTDHMDYEVPTDPNVTIEKWKLYSPLISRVINEMLAGRLSIDKSMDEMSTQEVQDLVDTWIWMKDFDPITNNYDSENAVVLAHNYDTQQGVTLNQYMFVKRLIDLYFNGEINLSTALFIEEQP